MKLTERQMLLVWKVCRKAGYGSSYYEFTNGHILDEKIANDFDHDRLTVLTENLAKKLKINMGDSLEY